MILILSEQHDVSTDKVVHWLTYLKATFLRINVEDEKSILNSITLSSDREEITFIFNNEVYSLKDFSVVWNRRGKINLKTPLITNKIIKEYPSFINALQRNVEEEYTTLLDYVYYKIGRVFSINNPKN